MKVVEPGFEILNYTDLRLIEAAGRVCYKSEGRIEEGSDQRITRSLIASHHEAMIEHSSMTVRFICDRGVSHEIVRHRLASFGQESTRYCNYSKDKYDNQIKVIDLATGFNYDLDNPQDAAKYEEWVGAMEDAEQHYLKMIELGATAQEARSVLPTSVKTEVVMTANYREWRHFFNLRALGTTGKPHPQMVEVALPLLKEVQKLIPVVFDDLEIKA